MHTPWYSTNEAHEGEGEKMRKAMEGLLYRAEVDIVFAGHIHTYERFVSTIFVNFSPIENTIPMQQIFKIKWICQLPFHMF